MLFFFETRKVAGSAKYKQATFWGYYFSLRTAYLLTYGQINISELA